jgi:uncharacterized protein
MKPGSRLPSALALLALGALLGSGRVAAMDCQRAHSLVEQTICGRPELQTLDHALNWAYAESLQRHPNRKAALIAQQKAWLRQRDGCGLDDSCLQTRYIERRKVLQLGLRTQPDATDARAVRALQGALEAQRVLNAEFALETALQSFAIREGITKFVNVEGTDGTAGLTFPQSRPNGVTANEWAALQRSNIDGGGEHGMATYTLLDVDADGQRDLIMDTYVGGTGLFNAVNVLLRRRGYFRGPMPGRRPLDTTSEWEDPTDLYTLNGRGSNQWATWIRLAGRVYVAYINGTYGRDQLTLLRPTGHPSPVAGWTLQYRYALSLPALQPGPANTQPRTLSEVQLASLRMGLQQVNASETQAATGPVCPPPPGATDEQILAYQSVEPIHYSMQLVKDFPVWMGQECRVGRLVNWFGRYGKHGLALSLSVTPPGEEHKQENFQVDGRRQLVRIEGGLLKDVAAPAVAPR